MPFSFIGIGSKMECSEEILGLRVVTALLNLRDDMRSIVIVNEHGKQTAGAPGVLDPAYPGNRSSRCWAIHEHSKTYRKWIGYDIVGNNRLGVWSMAEMEARLRSLTQNERKGWKRTISSPHFDM